MRTLLCAGLAFVSVVTHPAAQKRRARRRVALARRRSRQHEIRGARSNQQDNVSTLRIAWRRPGDRIPGLAGARPIEFSHDFRATPLMIDGVLYGFDGIGMVEAFHPGTGKTVWIQQAGRRRARRWVCAATARARCVLDRREPAAAVRHPR
jgi:glucose dehydrogenase